MKDLELFQLNFNRQSPTSGVVVTVSMKVAAGVADLSAFWRLRRDEILALPMVAGLDVGPEDISVALNRRTITGNLRFTDPKKA